MPVQIGADNEWSYVSASDFHTLATKSDGTLWGWGNGINGELGDSINYYRNTPFNIFPGNDWKIVAAGTHHSLAIKNDGTKVKHDSAIQIASGTNWLSIAAEGYSSFAIKKDSTLWGWGYNFQGNLGDGTTTDKLSPVQIGSFTNWKIVSPGLYHTAALRSDNTLWAWGNNSGGLLGDGTTISKLIPVQIPCSTNVLPVTLSFFNIQKYKSGIFLNWLTAPELNSKEFEIERSIDGTAFKPIGNVLTFNHATGTSYTFIDTIPFKGLNYYRLKHIDINGRVTYSPVRMILFTPSPVTACIFPNPVKDRLVIESNFTGENATIVITDVQGRKILKSVKGNSLRWEIQTTYLKPGLYIVTISDGTANVTRKIIKQ